MDYLKKSGRGALLILLLALIGTSIGYITRIILARSLSVADYGLIYSILSFVALFTIFRDLSLNTSLLKFLPEYLIKNKFDVFRQVIRYVIKIQILIAFIIVFIIIFFAHSLSISYFKNEAAYLPLIFISLSFLISTFLSTFQTVLQTNKRILYYALSEPARIILVLFFVVILLPLGIVSVGYAYLFASIILVLILFFIIKKTMPFFGPVSKDSKNTKNVFNFGIALFIGSVSGTVINYADTLIITALKNLNDVGLYQAALPVSQLLWFFVGSTIPIIIPTISELIAKNENNAIKNGIEILIKTIGLITAGFVVIFITLPDRIISISFGAKYLDAALALQILAIGAVFYAAYTILSNTLIGLGKAKIFTKIFVTISLINLILDFIMIYFFSIIGAAVTNVVTYVIGSIICYFYVSKEIKINFNFLYGLKLILICAINSIFILLIKNVFTGITGFLILVFVSLIVFYVLFILVKPLEKEEIEKLKSSEILPKFMKILIR